MKLENVSTFNEAQQAKLADRMEVERETFIRTIEMLNATHQTHMQELQGNLSKNMQEMEHFITKLQGVEMELENQQNTVDYLTKTTEGHLAQNRQEDDIVIDTSDMTDMKMQCPDEKRDNVGLWQNEPAISTNTPNKVDMVDFTHVPEDVNEGGGKEDCQSPILIVLCISFICICEFAMFLGKKVSHKLGGLALMAVSMSSVSFIFTWYFYPALCLNFMSSFVRGYVFPFFSFVFFFMFHCARFPNINNGLLKENMFRMSLLLCCASAMILNS